MIFIMGIRVDRDGYRGKIESALTKSLGRTVSIEGTAEVVIGFSPTPHLEDVRVFELPGWGEGDLATDETISGMVSILPLMFGNLSIDKFFMEWTSFRLAGDRDRRATWLSGKLELRDEASRMRCSLPVRHSLPILAQGGHAMAVVYLLANTLPGKEKTIRDTLRGTKGIDRADIITGQFDVAAVLTAKDTNTIFNKILKEVRKIKGLTRTETFVAVE